MLTLRYNLGGLITSYYEWQYSSNLEEHMKQSFRVAQMQGILKEGMNGQMCMNVWGESKKIE